MPQDEREVRDLEELTVEELEQQEALELPDREALSILAPHLPSPADPGGALDLQPRHGAQDEQPLAPPDQPGL
jgi:hypothetical protein